MAGWFPSMRIRRARLVRHALRSMTCICAQRQDLARKVQLRAGERSLSDGLAREEHYRLPYRFPSWPECCTRMPLSRSVDIYCERTDASLWSEPFNALTNASFFLAAWLLAREIVALQRGGKTLPASIRALPALLALVGACSLLFHTLATVWAGLADQLAILLYGCVFLYGFLRHPARWSAVSAGLGAAVFSVASYFTPSLLPDGFLNQSGAYFPYLAGLLGIGLWLRVQRRPSYTLFAGGIALFVVSLALRTVDARVCDSFPLGTHFAWHLLNGVVLYLLSCALAREAAVDAL
jgi:hypothetical protein